MQRQHLGVGIAAAGLPGGPDERRRGGGGPGLDQEIVGGELEQRAEPGREASPATTSIRSRGMRPVSRSTASSAVEPAPESGSSCLGSPACSAARTGCPSPRREARPSASEQRGQRRAVLAQIVEQGTDVGVGAGQDREPVLRARAGQNQEPARRTRARRWRARPDRRPRPSGPRAGPVSPRAPPPSPSRRRRAQSARSAGRHRSGAARPRTPSRAARLWTTSPNGIMGRTPGQRETLRNVGTVPVEVKK